MAAEPPLFSGKPCGIYGGRPLICLLFFDDEVVNEEGPRTVENLVGTAVGDKGPLG